MSRLYGFLFLAGGGAPAAWVHNFMRAASRILTGASPPPPECMCQAVPFPTDNWLRDDIGLPPLADDRPTLPHRLTLRKPAYFPTDDRLRVDIGLPPLGEGSDDERALLNASTNTGGTVRSITAIRANEAAYAGAGFN